MKDDAGMQIVVGGDRETRSVDSVVLYSLLTINICLWMEYD